MKGVRIAVGGGCGFLGSYLVPVLVGRGARVTVVDNLQNGTVEALAGVRDAVRFVEGDLADRATCDAVLAGQDVFVNLAARASGVGFSRAHHGEMLVDNLLCGLVPLDAARRAGVGSVVVTSTSCVYPDDAPVPTPELDAFTGWPERVNEGYGWAKRIQELAAHYYEAEHRLPVTIVRPFNLYGANYPWRSVETAHVIPSLVKRILDGEDPVVVWGTGEQRRNFLHGRDAAELVARIIESGARGTVNLGYEEDVRIADLVALICEVTRRRPRIVFDTSKPDGQARKSADASRLREITGGYVPRVALRQGIEEMVDWYERTFGQRSGPSTVAPSA
jgi:nucleoside-diphosphate-sugar epimerase